jgi:hypothetical protein
MDENGIKKKWRFKNKKKKKEQGFFTFDNQHN